MLKPSEATPISALYLAELFQEVGFPDGVLNVVTGNGSETGSMLVNHKGINKIAFTGSTNVGKIIGKTAMENMIPVSLELGGKSPAIVFKDADLESAAKGVAMGIFRNAGQVCVAGSRLYIQENIYDDFLTKIADIGRSMKLSHGFDADADIGPLVTRSHHESVSRYIQKGIDEGATKLSGGSNPKDVGYYIEPTVFATQSNDKVIVNEEIFGPVLVGIPFKDKNDALEKANNNNFGLAGTIWTKDIDKAISCVKQLESGLIAVNGPVRSDPHLPLGGYKQSGVGTDLGKEGLYAYTKLKSVNIIYKNN